MPEFLELVSPDDALSILFQAIQPVVKGELISTVDGLGRVTINDVHSGQNLPDFRRSTVDGYAVISRDTHGASESLPAYLKIAGEVPMGAAPDFQVTGKTCSDHPYRWHAAGWDRCSSHAGRQPDPGFRRG